MLSVVDEQRKSAEQNLTDSSAAKGSFYDANSSQNKPVNLVQEIGSRSLEEEKKSSEGGSNQGNQKFNPESSPEERQALIAQTINDAYFDNPTRSKLFSSPD